MESSATSYLLTLAVLGMTFMGFAAVVMLLRFIQSSSFTRRSNE
jgi:hypothetical protein